MFYVYELIDSNTNKVFYVGKGTGQRIYVHRWISLLKKHPNKHLQNKILQILNANNHIIYKKIFESNIESDIFLKEKEFIKFYGRQNLCNLTDGGDGVSGYHHSNKTKKLLAEKNNIRWADPKQRKRMSILTKRRMKNPIEREKISKKLMNRKLSFETRKKMMNHKCWQLGNDSRKHLICKNCGCKFKAYRGMFCKNSCFREYFAAKFIKKLCICRNLFETKKCRPAKFCSRLCSDKYRGKDDIYKKS